MKVKSNTETIYEFFKRKGAKKAQRTQRKKINLSFH